MPPTRMGVGLRGQDPESPLLSSQKEAGTRASSLSGAAPVMEGPVGEVRDPEKLKPKTDGKNGVGSHKLSKVNNFLCPSQLPEC